MAVTGTQLAAPRRFTPEEKARLGLDQVRPELVRSLAISGLFFVVFGGWAALVPIDAGVVADGVVTVSGNRQTVQHRDGGVVGELHVREGDTVEAGQILIQLKTTEIAAQERALFSQAIELQARRARLIAEEAGASVAIRPPEWDSLSPADQAAADEVFARQTAELGARRTSVRSRIDVLEGRREQLVARIPGYQRQRESAVEQIRLLEDEIKALQELVDKQLAPVSRLRALERGKAELEGRIGQIDAQISEANEAMGETGMQILSLRATLGEDRAAALREAETQLATILPRLEATRAQLAAASIRAPSTGVVVGLSAFTVGGVIEPGGRIMDIVPSDRKLVIEAHVRPDMSDEIQSGNPARIRFRAVGNRNAPVLEGAVTTISADRMIDQATGAAFFRAEIEVPPAELERLVSGDASANIDMRPGVPVDVILTTERRTALQYLIDPLTRTLWRSFRES